MRRKPIVYRKRHGPQRCSGRSLPPTAQPAHRRKFMVARTSRSIFAGVNTLSTQHGPPCPHTLWQRRRCMSLSVDGLSCSSEVPHGHIFEVLYSSKRTTGPRTARVLTTCFLGTGACFLECENVPSPIKIMRRCVLLRVRIVDLSSIFFLRRELLASNRSATRLSHDAPPCLI